MKRRLFQKKDILLLTVLLIIALLVFLFTARDSGDTAEIWIGGKLYGSYPLNTPFEVMLDNGAAIKGDGKSAWFEHSDCPDKVCIETGKLSVSGQWAACLPNETVLKILKDNGDVDTVS